MTLVDIVPVKIAPVFEDDLYGLEYEVTDVDGKSYRVGGKAVHFNLYGICHVFGAEGGVCASKRLVASLLARQESWNDRPTECRVLSEKEADEVFRRLGVPQLGEKAQASVLMG